VSSTAFRRVAGAVLLAVVLASCSGSDGPDRVAPRPVNSSASSTSSTVALVNLTTVPEPTLGPLVTNVPRTTLKGTTVISVKVNPGTSPGSSRATKDVSDTICAPGPSGWSVSGRVTNPTRVPVTYRIYIAFVTSQGATHGLLQVDVERVEAESAANWSGELALNEVSLACVVRAERSPAKT